MIPNKSNFKFQELTPITGVKPYVIRFWETEFEILKPRKNPKGNRLFTKKDLDNLKIIYHLVKEKGFTLEGARKKLKETPENPLDHKVDVIEKLKSIRSFLNELQNQL